MLSNIIYSCRVKTTHEKHCNMKPRELPFFSAMSKCTCLPLKVVNNPKPEDAELQKQAFDHRFTLFASRPLILGVHRLRLP